MIDLRCHILDGTPCGPSTFTESLEMCRAAVVNGIKTIVATPRWAAGNTVPPLAFKECWRKIERLEAEMNGALSVKLGFLLEFSPELPSLVALYGSKLALAGKQHLLIRLPTLEIPAKAEEVWKSLIQRGFSIVLAHPECNTMLRRKDARLEQWVLEGMKLQVDIASVAGTHGRDVQRFALECLRKYESQIVIASNARKGASNILSYELIRGSLMSKIGRQQTVNFVRDTPAKLIDDAIERNKSKVVSTHRLASLLRLITLV